MKTKNQIPPYPPHPLFARAHVSLHLNCYAYNLQTQWKFEQGRSREAGFHPNGYLQQVRASCYMSACHLHMLIWNIYDGHMQNGHVCCRKWKPPLCSYSRACRDFVTLLSTKPEVSDSFLALCRRCQSNHVKSISWQEKIMGRRFPEERITLHVINSDNTCSWCGRIRQRPQMSFTWGHSTWDKCFKVAKNSFQSAKCSYQRLGTNRLINWEGPTVGLVTPWSWT